MESEKVKLFISFLMLCVFRQLKEDAEREKKFSTINCLYQKYRIEEEDKEKK